MPRINFQNRGVPNPLCYENHREKNMFLRKQKAYPIWKLQRSDSDPVRWKHIMSTYIYKNTHILKCMFASPIKDRQRDIRERERYSSSSLISFGSILAIENLEISFFNFLSVSRLGSKGLCIRASFLFLIMKSELPRGYFN